MATRRRTAAPTGIEDAPFPPLDLSLVPPYPPMEATRSDQLPEGDLWQFEPKLDGFRALAFRSGDEVVLQSKGGQPLTRYFPEVVEALRKLRPRELVLDGEIVIVVDGHISFDHLLQRIHPAESRVHKLAAETPATYFVFDLLVRGKTLLAELPIERRRAKLEELFESIASDSIVQLTPATTDRARALDWFERFGPAGLDGVMAKRLGEPYHSGDREAMVKVKHLRTADCVVGGFRITAGTDDVASLLLGLYDNKERFVYIGHTSSFRKEERRPLRQRLAPLESDNPFEVRVPGGPSRWSNGKSAEWIAVKPELVCEVEYDYFSQGRFRHGSKFLRWRPEKPPRQCTFEQVLPPKRKRSGAGTTISDLAES